MKKSQLFILSCLIFCVCCSMSKCAVTYGPETTIHGIVKDYSTNQPVAGLQLKVAYEYTESGQTQYSPVTTNSDGSYSLKFTPIGAFASFLLVGAGNSVNDYYIPVSGNIILGANNDINVYVNKFVDVTINLKSTVSEDQPKLELLIVGQQFPFEKNYVYSAIVNTVIDAHIPRLGSYAIDGVYFNPSSGGGVIYPNFVDSLNVGNADTTINITNP